MSTVIVREPGKRKGRRGRRGKRRSSRTSSANSRNHSGLRRRGGLEMYLQSRAQRRPSNNPPKIPRVRPASNSKGAKSKSRGLRLMGPNQKYRKEYMRIPDLPARVKTLKRQELNVLANIMTPYSCRPVRICASTGVNNPPLTAVSTNFLVEDYDLQSLLSLTEGQIVELPEIDKNQLLWNLPNDISVVLLQDTYTPLIYPKYTGDTVGVYYDTIFLDPNFTHGNTPYYDIEVEPNEVFADVMNQKISPLSLIRNSSDLS